MGMDRLDKRGESLHDLSPIFVYIYNEHANIIYIDHPILTTVYQNLTELQEV